MTQPSALTELDNLLAELAGGRLSVASMTPAQLHARLVGGLWWRVCAEASVQRPEDVLQWHLGAAEQLSSVFLDEADDIDDDSMLSAARAVAGVGVALASAQGEIAAETGDKALRWAIAQWTTANILPHANRGATVVRPTRRPLEDRAVRVLESIDRMGRSPAHAYAALVTLFMTSSVAVRHRQSVRVLFEAGSARPGRTAVLTLGMLDGGPAGLYPDPTVMSFLRADRDFADALTAAWEHVFAKRDHAGPCVVWSISQDSDQIRPIHGGSLGVPFAIALTELAHRGRPLGRLRGLRVFPERRAVTGAVLPNGQVGDVGGLDSKLDAASAMGWSVVAPLVSRDRVSSKPAGMNLQWARTIRQARRKTKAWVRGRVIAVVVAVSVLLAGTGTAFEWQSLTTLLTASRTDTNVAQRKAEVVELLASASTRRDSQPEAALRLGLAALALDESTPAEANAGLVSTLTAGRQFYELHHGDSTVESVQLGPNGLALTADGGDVELSDVSNISLPRGRVPLGSSGGPAVVATALAEDGKIAVVARAQQAGAPNPNTYEIWDTSDPEHPQVAGNAGSCAPDAVAVNSVSSLVLAGCFDGSATLWSITDRAHPQRVADLARSGGPAVHAVAISASGNRAVVGSDAGLAIWDLAGNGEPVQDHDSYRPTAPTMNEPAVPVYSVGIDRKGSTIIFGSNGGGAQVVQTRSSRAGNPPPQELNVQGQTGGVVEVAASADGSTLLTAGQNAVIVWKNDTGGVFTPRAIMRNHAEAVSTVAVSPDGRTALSGGLDGRAVLSNLAVDYKYSLSYERKSFTNRPDAVACSRSVSTCVVTTDAGEAIVWDVTDPAAPQRMAALTAVPVSGGAVAFADSHAVVAAGGKDGTITLLDVSDPAHPLQLGTAAAVAAGVTAVAFKPGADTLAVGSSDGVVTLFSVDAAFGLHRLNSIDEHHGAVRSLSFPRSGPVLASGYGDGAVMLLPAGSSTPLLRLPGGVRSVAMSTESDPLLAAADGAPNLVYWQPGDSANGVIPYGGHTGVVNSVGYNDTGTMAVTASADATAIVWSMVDPADPRPMVAMTGHTDAVTSAAFANRGSTVVTVGADHQLITWDISRLAAIAADPRASACHAAGRAFTASEWQAQRIPAQFPYVNSCP